MSVTVGPSKGQRYKPGGAPPRRPQGVSQYRRNSLATSSGKPPGAANWACTVGSADLASTHILVRLCLPIWIVYFPGGGVYISIWVSGFRVYFDLLSEDALSSRGVEAFTFPSPLPLFFG